MRSKSSFKINGINNQSYTSRINTDYITKYDCFNKIITDKESEAAIEKEESYPIDIQNARKAREDRFKTPDLAEGSEPCSEGGGVS